MKIDWRDQEQVNQYQREWRKRNPDKVEQYKAKKREERANRPAAPGVKGRGSRDTGFMDVAYSTENMHDELSWGIDKEKLRRNREE